MSKKQQKKYNELESWDQKLKDNNLPTLAETEKYRKTTGWVPYNEYMETIFHHCPGREFDEFNLHQNCFDKQLEPDRLLREAAYLIALKQRPCNSHDSIWTEEEQLELEEMLYTKLRSFATEWYIIDDLD